MLILFGLLGYLPSDLFFIFRTNVQTESMTYRSFNARGYPGGTAVSPPIGPCSATHLEDPLINGQPLIELEDGSPLVFLIHQLCCVRDAEFILGCYWRTKPDRHRIHS
jgi:hypothetical protein